MSENLISKEQNTVWFHHSVLALPRFQKARQEWIQETAEIHLKHILKDCPVAGNKETDFNIEPTPI